MGHFLKKKYTIHWGKKRILAEAKMGHLLKQSWDNALIKTTLAKAKMSDLLNQKENSWWSQDVTLVEAKKKEH